MTKHESRTEARNPLFNIGLQLASMFFEKLLSADADPSVREVAIRRVPIHQPEPVVFSNVEPVDGKLPDLMTRLTTDDGQSFTITLKDSFAPQTHAFVEDYVKRFRCGASATALATAQSVENAGFVSPLSPDTTLHGSATIIVKPEPPA